MADWLAHASGPVRAEVRDHLLRGSDELATSLEQNNQLTALLIDEDRRQQP